MTDSHDSGSKPDLTNSLLIASKCKTPSSSVALCNESLTRDLKLVGLCCLCCSLADLELSLDDSSLASSWGRFAAETAFARDFEFVNCSTRVASEDPHLVHFALVPFLRPKECPH